jgi:hypothetical protein
MKVSKIEEKALSEYLNNYACPNDITDKYKLDPDRFRKIIEIHFLREMEQDMYNQVGNTSIDFDD